MIARDHLDKTADSDYYYCRVIAAPIDDTIRHIRILTSHQALVRLAIVALDRSNLPLIESNRLRTWMALLSVRSSD
eukprot:scaffold348074_cov30-Prasinocladus_malaysianus.AAC.4